MRAFYEMPWGFLVEIEATMRYDHNGNKVADIVTLDGSKPFTDGHELKYKVDAIVVPAQDIIIIK